LIGIQRARAGSGNQRRISPEIDLASADVEARLPELVDVAVMGGLALFRR